MKPELAVASSVELPVIWDAMTLMPVMGCILSMQDPSFWHTILQWRLSKPGHIYRCHVENLFSTGSDDRHLLFLQYTSDGSADTFSPDVDSVDVKSIVVEVVESTGSYTINSIDATVCCSPVGECGMFLCFHVVTSSWGVIIPCVYIGHSA